MESDVEVESDPEVEPDMEPEFPNFDTCSIPYADELIDEVKDNVGVIRMIDHKENVSDFCSVKNPASYYEEREPGPFASVEDWDEWRQLYQETYRPPQGYVFGHWVRSNTGLKVKPEARLYDIPKAIELFCLLNMDTANSVWWSEMCITDMYEAVLRCPCEDKACIRILLRLRECMSVKKEVYMSFLTKHTHTHTHTQTD